MAALISRLIGFEGLVDQAHGRVGDHGGGLHFLGGVLRQRVQAELLAQPLEIVLLAPARAEQARHLCGRQGGVGGHDRRLALLALVDPEADLAHGEAALQQLQRALGDAPAPGLEPEGRAQRDGGRAELLVRPAFLLAALAPGNAGHPARVQVAEQLRAPALAVEGQRQRRRGGRGGGRRGQQPQLLQFRQQLLAQDLDHAGIDLLAQAQQGLAAGLVDPEAGVSRQLQALP